MHCKLNHRLICALLAMLMPFLLAAPAFAQDETPEPFVICGDMSEEDCTLHKESALAMQDAGSYSMSMHAEFNMSGIPDMPVDPLGFAMQIDGSFAMDDTARAASKELNAMARSGSAEDMAKAESDMEQMMLDLFGGLDFDLSVQYTLPPELAQVLSEDSDVQLPESLTLGVRLVDGMMYINVGDLRALDPSIAEELTSDWIGMDYVGMLEMQMQAGGTTGESMAASAAAGVVMQQMMQDMNDFVAVERLDNVDLGDQEGAAYAYTYDVAGFVASDAFGKIVEELLAASGEDISASDTRQALTMLSFMAPMLFRDLELTAGSVIGLDDKYPYSQSIDFNWDLKSLVQLAGMSDPSLAEALGDAEPAISLGVTIDFSDFNDEIIVEVPDDVQVIPLEQLVPTDTSVVL